MSTNCNNYKELINKSECLQIIKAVMSEEIKFNLNVNDFQYEIVEATDDARGYLGEYYNLKIIIKKNKRSKGKLFQYFIKTIPVTNELHKKLVNKLNIFPKEVQFYTDLFKEMEKYSQSNWHCKNYYTRSDLLVFENLTLFGFRNLHDNENFTEYHIQTTLKCMAQMHCSSIVLEEKSGFNIGQKYESSLHEISLLDSTGWFRAGLRAIQAITAIIPKYQNKMITELVPNPNSYDELLQMSNPSIKYRNTFCHRDIWDRNILFKYDETDKIPKEAILVDFQNCRYCLPAVDFMMFLILNQSSCEMKKNFNCCTIFYYDNLKNYLKNYEIEIENILKYDEFLITCSYVKLLPFVFKAVYLPFTAPPDKLFFVNLQRDDPITYNHYLEVDRTECILKFANDDENFRNLMFEAVEDVVNCFAEYKNTISLKLK